MHIPVKNALWQERVTVYRAPATGRPTVSVVIPTYNEEQCIADTIDQLTVHLGECCDDFEIIVVNDGSTDGTPHILRERTDIRLIEHAGNCGYGAALKTGIRHARFPLIVITDADGTYPSEHLPRLLERAAHADMVVGARTGDSVEYPLIRRIPKWFLVRFAEWMARRRIPDLNSGLRIFHKRDVTRFLNILPDGFSFTTTITLALLTNGYVVDFEPIDYRRRIGKSKIHPVLDTLRLARTIFRTGMYFAPLRVFLPIAAAFFAAFVGTFVYDLLVPQNLSEKTLMLFVASTQLAMFGLLADMIDKRSTR